MKKSASAGFGFTPGAVSNLLGFGVNWGEPSNSFGMGLDDQYAVEAFYRLQLSDETALTTDVQLLLDPALNPENDSIWVLGLRARIAL
jgi:porin